MSPDPSGALYAPTVVCINFEKIGAPLSVNSWIRHWPALFCDRFSWIYLVSVLPQTCSFEIFIHCEFIFWQFSHILKIYRSPSEFILSHPANRDKTAWTLCRWRSQSPCSHEISQDTYHFYISIPEIEKLWLNTFLRLESIEIVD